MSRSIALVAPRSFFRPYILGLVLSVAVLASGCDRRSTSDAATSDTVIVALSANPSTLDPRRATDAIGSRIAGLLFSSIVRVGPDLKIKGEAALSWRYEKLTWTFILRPGLVFSNGRALTAEDIEFSFNEYLNAKSPFAGALKSVESVKASYGPTGGELKLKLNKFTANLLSELSPVKLLPKKETVEAGADFSRVLIGTGPFTFLSADANEIRLKGRPDHVYAAPKVRNVVFKIVRDDNTRVLKVLKGEIDIAQQELPPSRIKELEGVASLEVHKYQGLGMTYLLLNLTDARLAKLDFRRAIADAINRDEIIRHKLDGLALPAASLLSPVNPYHDSSLRGRSFSPDSARATVEHLGLKGTKLVLKTSSVPSAVENGRVIANQLNAIGLDVTLQSFEWGTFYGDIQKGNFQLATMRWVGITDPDLYRSAFHSKEQPPVGRNRGHYVNPALDRSLEKGLTFENEVERIKHYRLVQKTILEDLPIIPLWYDKEIAVVNRRIKGYRPPLNGDFTPLTEIEKTQVRPE